MSKELDRFYETGAMKFNLAGSLRSMKVRIKRAWRPGLKPETLVPDEWAINCWDKKLWIGDENGIPVEHKLGQVKL